MFIFWFFLQWGHIDRIVLLTQLFSWYQCRVNLGTIQTWHYTYHEGVEIRFHSFFTSTLGAPRQAVKGGLKAQPHALLPSTLNWGQRSASRARSLHLWQNSSRYHMHGIRTGLKTVWRKKKLPLPGVKPLFLGPLATRSLLFWDPKVTKLTHTFVCHSWLVIAYVVRSCYVSDDISTGMVLKRLLPGSLVEHAGFSFCKVDVHWRHDVPSSCSNL